VNKLYTNKRSPDVAPGIVLVVDDDADDARAAVRTINKLFPELSTRAVYSGEDLISYLQGENEFSDRNEHPYPLLVLLDLKMGGVSGFDVLLWLRDHPPHNYIPVIVLTGTGELNMASRAYALGARSFLTKPLQRVELENAVRGFEHWVQQIRASVNSAAVH